MTWLLFTIPSFLDESNQNDHTDARERCLLFAPKVDF
jgi:hypothetical protein